jgi:hypothetical protein
VVAEWTATLNLRPSTLDLYRYLARRYLLPALGRAELAMITRPTSAYGLRQCATSLSPNTIAKAYRLLSG